MSREILPYTDEATRNAERAKDLTSTDVAALFGVSPYLSAFELWHRKAGNLVVDDVENERTKWGTLLQDAIAEGVGRERGWALARKNDYVRMPELRVASSFDFEGGWAETVDAGPAFVGGRVGTVQFHIPPQFLVECKNVDSLAFRRGWIETDFGLEAPAHIELQAQHQCLVADVKRIYIVALVGGNTLHVLERERDDVIAQRILDAAAEFWARTEPPAPDFRQDAATISRLYGYSSAGKVIDADTETTQLLAEYHEAGTRKRAAEAEQDEAKARLLLRIGDAEKVQSEIGTLSCGMVKAAHIEYDRKEYRSFKFTARREK